MRNFFFSLHSFAHDVFKKNYKFINGSLANTRHGQCLDEHTISCSQVRKADNTFQLEITPESQFPTVIYGAERRRKKKKFSDVSVIYRFVLGFWTKRENFAVFRSVYSKKMKKNNRRQQQLFIFAYSQVSSVHRFKRFRIRFHYHFYSIKKNRVR